MEKNSTLVFFLILLISPVFIFAHSYQIGHRQLNLYGPSRTKDIGCHFYFPSNTAGDNVAVATGQFPYIVFGHGFSMGYEAYMKFVDSLVPHGCVLCFPTTEGGLSPNHESFGLDLRFLNNEIKSNGQSDAGFFLYQKLTSKSAIMGHSMGGGSSFLAAENNTNLTTLVTFAPAETSVSAIAAASNVTVPALVFIKENDGVTPPADHQIPMYNNMPVGCKGSVTIKGGGHCYFANYNYACSTGEMFTSLQPTITRDDQHEVVFAALIPYLAWMLQDNGPQRTVFEGVIAQTATYTSQFNCTVASADEFKYKGVKVFPNPALETITLLSESGKSGDVMIYSASGNLIYSEVIVSDEYPKQISVAEFPQGLYFIKITEGERISILSFMKQ